MNLATWLNIPAATEGDITKFEYRVEISSSPSDGEAIDPTLLVPLGTKRIPIYSAFGSIFIGSTSLWGRWIDSSGNTSTWASAGTPSWSGTYAGNMGSQNSDSVTSSGTTVSQGSGRQLKAVYPFNVVAYTPSGSATEQPLNIPISGFSYAPDAGDVVCADPAGAIARYEPGDGSSSSTNAVVRVSWANGTAFGGSTPVRITGTFFAYA
jgi:hypothetical protein